MSKIEKYEKFLNERKSSSERKAERKLRKAEKKAEKAEKAFEEGNDKKGERKLKKAMNKLEDAKELDSSIDTSELDNEIRDMSTKDWDEEFDIVASKLGKKVKVKDLDFINKFKIKGDEISTEELKLFLKTVKSYINEFWDDISEDRNKEEYLSPYSDNMVIIVKNRKNKIIFVHKEKKLSDKIKLILEKDFFEDNDNLDDINNEFSQLLKDESLLGLDSKVSKNYNKSKDDNDIIKKDKKSMDARNIAVTTTSLLNTKIENIAKSSDVEKAVETLNTPSPEFINSATNILIEEKLNLGGVTNLTNTNEDKIYKFFVEDNPSKTVVGKNINEILINYRKKKSTMRENIININTNRLNEAWYNDWEDFKGGVNNMSKSIVSNESKGVVQDLMYAFNTDSKALSKEINKIIRKISRVQGEKITKEIIAEVNDTKKEISSNKNISNNENEINENASSTALGVGGAVVAYKGAGMAGRSALLAGRGLMSVLGIIPVWGWIAIGAISIGSYALNSFEEQRYQLAKMFILMYSSKSEEFMKEIKQAGIVINGDKKMQIDIDAIKKALLESNVDEKVNNNLLKNWTEFKK